MTNKKKFLFVFLVLLLLSIPSIIPLLRAGFYEPHDLHHIADIYEMFRAIEAKQFPPRLGPDFIFGYGYPLFNFYYVLPFYLGAFGFFLLGSLTSAFKFVFILSVVISVIGMYLFLHEFVGKLPSLVGSILYLYTPYRAVEIYVRGALGEAIAISLLPYVALMIIKIIKIPFSPRMIGMASFVFGLFIISHNLFPLLALPWLFLLVFLYFVREASKKEVALRLFLMTFLGFGISFYWWFPAITEHNLVTSKTPFFLEDHFPFIKQLIIPSWGYESSVWGPNDGMSFQIGIVNLVIVFVFLILLIFFRKIFKQKNLIIISLWAIAGFIVSVFMMNIRSLGLWMLIPFYEFVQFPWRILFLTTFFSAIISGLVVHIIPKYIWQKIVGAIIVISCIFLTLGYFHPSSISTKSDNEYLSRFFVDREVSGKKETISQNYLSYSEDYLLLPNWTEKKPKTMVTNKIESQEADIYNIKQINSSNWEADVAASRPSNIIFHSLYFPGWIALVDNREVEIKPLKPYGDIGVTVDKGVHTVKFFWQETPLRKFADMVSLGSLVIIIFLTLRMPNDLK